MKVEIYIKKKIEIQDNDLPELILATNKQWNHEPDNDPYLVDIIRMAFRLELIDLSDLSDDFDSDRDDWDVGERENGNTRLSDFLGEE